MVSGFITCHTHPVYKYKLHRFEGQYLYLKSAWLGIVNFIFGVLIVIFFDNNLPSYINICSFSFPLDIQQFVNLNLQNLNTLSTGEAEDLSWILIITVTTLIVPYIWSFLSFSRLCIRFKTTHPNTQISGTILSDSPLDNFLFNASLEKGDYQIMVTLSDRKVYVGKVNNLGEPNESEGADQEISIVPTMSGYREKDSLEVKFTTLYSGLSEDTFIILRQDSILSVSEFSFDIYEELNPKKEKWKPI